jgi:membrane associated rhomboid family serine protease
MNEASVGFQCPECVSEGRRTQRSAKTVFGGSRAGAHGYVTIGLVALNLIVGIVTLVMGGAGGLSGGAVGGIFGGSTWVTEWGASAGQAIYEDSLGHRFLGPYAVADGEYYRLVTAMFIHLGPLHLLMNMWALWVLGRNLEAALGPVRFAALYLLSGIGGNVAVYLFDPYPGAAGSSTAIFGLFAALFIVLRRLKRDTSSIIPILVINVIISFIPGISFWGHLGGAVTGAIVSLALAYAPKKHRVVALTAVTAGLLMIFGVAVAMQTRALQDFVPI